MTKQKYVWKSLNFTSELLKFYEKKLLEWKTSSLYETCQSKFDNLAGGWMDRGMDGGKPGFDGKLSAV